jgi:hypothetical protein
LEAFCANATIGRLMSTIRHAITDFTLDIAPPMQPASTLFLGMDTKYHFPARSATLFRLEDTFQPQPESRTLWGRVDPDVWFTWT